MSDSESRALRDLLLSLLPEDGTAIGNKALREALAERLGEEVDEARYFAVREPLIEAGLLLKGQGRGGSVRLAAARAEPVLNLEAQAIPDAAKQPKPQQAGLKLGVAQAKPKRARVEDAGAAKVLAYRHDQTRINNPEVGMVTPDTDAEERARRWAYDPHIDPALSFDVGRAGIERLIDDALASGEVDTMREALATLKRMAEPYLNWAGKAERTRFEIDTVSLHVHERIDPAAILGVMKKRMQQTPSMSQGDFFRAWFESPLPYREAIEFYRHERGWANRLISGDSLLVMNSLLQKEGMAGQVQMIYIDPPYGIKYGSNFQPFVDRKPNQTIDKEEDLTREPEMIKAFRDTWQLGVHSYLTYLRDRLLLARELLGRRGSVFVQISDDNLHHVRELLDDVFGGENFVANIAYRTKIPLGTTYLSSTYDYLVWYARNKGDMLYRKLFQSRATGAGTQFTKIETDFGSRRTLEEREMRDDSVISASGRLFRSTDLVSSGFTESCAFAFDLDGRRYEPKLGKSWKTNPAGIEVLKKARRILHGRAMPAYAFFADDYPVQEFTNVWSDTQGASDKAYVVETSEKVVERCLLMTTAPGDLVLDPTCGSGTTARVAEKWGRRWITCDTSRVALTLAKQRLMTASFDYYRLRYPHEGLRGDFVYATERHVTLGSIARNSEINDLWTRMHPAVEGALAELNAALCRASHPHPSPGGSGALEFEVTEGGRKGETLRFDAGNRHHTLPTGEQVPANALLEWEVPFEFPADWPEAARAPFAAFHAARQAMQKRMDDSIAAHADQEQLFDQPEVDKSRLRITGPFTVEAVPFPSVKALDASAPAAEADASVAREGESSRQHQWRAELLKTGIRGKGGQMLHLADLEPLPGLRHLHCSGSTRDSGERVVVSFGPEHAALEQRQVELAMREAGELFPRPKMIVFCAFTFDPEAAKDIDAQKGITALKVQMNTDLLTEDLKKARASNQSFWLMGQPDVEVYRCDAKGRRLPPDASASAEPLYVVEVNGFDYFDTAKGELVSGGKAKIAAWSLDTDYDERSLFPRQVFFPMAGAKDGWNKLKKDIRAELDERLLDRLHGTVSLPFAAGEHRKIAVKIVDDRGIESLKVIALD